MRVGAEIGRGLSLGGSEREAPGDEHDIAVADNRDAQTGEQEHLDIVERHRRQVRHRQPRGDLTHDRHPVRLQVQRGRDPGGQRHRDERAGQRGAQPAQEQDDCQRACGDGERQPVGFGRDAQEAAHLLDDRSTLIGGPGQLAELAHDHQYGAACQVADKQ